MYLEKKILALIPARGGSKGIKDKNIIDLNGKPLIAHTIVEAKKSQYIDNVVVTTDSEKIAMVSKEYGASVPFLRPAYLANDTSKTIDAVLHAIEFLSKEEKYDVLVLLQPTQPLRKFFDIDGAIEKFFEHGMQDLVSISEVEENPLLIRKLDEDGYMKRLVECNSTCRRQDMPKYYRINGCIYINAIDKIDKNTSFNDNIIPYVMDKERAIDIDELKDLVLAEWFIKNN